MPQPRPRVDRILRETITDPIGPEFMAARPPRSVPAITKEVWWFEAAHSAGE